MVDKARTKSIFLSGIQKLSWPFSLTNALGTVKYDLVSEAVERMASSPGEIR